MQRVPSVEQILRAVSEEFSVPVTEIMGRERYKTIATARHVALYLCRKLRSMSYPELGRQSGHKDHSSAMNSVARAKARIEQEPSFRARVLRIEADAMHRAQRGAA